MVRFITTKELGEFIPKLVELERSYFGDQAFNESQVRYWWEARRFFFSGTLDPETGKMRSSMSMLLIDEDNYRALQKGAHEADMVPYRIASRKVGYLYLGGMIIDDKHHTPFMYHKICKDVVQCAQTEDIPVKYCFSVPTAQSVKKLLEKFGFKQDGLYREKFPMMVAPTVGKFMWQAFLQGAEVGEPFRRHD